MLPEAIREFIQKPRLGALVTVGAERRPTLHRCTGFRAGSGATDFSIVVADSRRLDLAAAIRVQPKVAIVVGAVDNFDAFQMKGHATVRRANEQEIAQASQ